MQACAALCLLACLEGWIEYLLHCMCMRSSMKSITPLYAQAVLAFRHQVSTWIANKRRLRTVDFALPRMLTQRSSGRL